LKAIQAKGAELVAVSYDDVSILKGFADGNEITFPLLSDQVSAIIKAYGIYHQDGLPHPGTFVIDREGIVRATLFIEGYRERHSVDELLHALDTIP
jgi:peroxiredoxin